MRRQSVLCACALSAFCAAQADDVLHRYEGEILPYAPGAGWVINRRCEGGCSEALQDGHLVVTYVDQNVAAGFLYGYDRGIARQTDPQPPTLWVEWGYRSEQPLPPFAYTCDGGITVGYMHFVDHAFLFGDAIVSFSGDDVVRGLTMSDFHTYRFESLDGIHYRMSVDGLVFREAFDDTAIFGAYVQFGGDGGCGPEYYPTINEWDFVRYGTIAYGEEIVSSDPPAGFVDARAHRALDRFTVTFDQPNYVYIDEITVEVTTTKPRSHEATKGGFFELRTSNFELPPPPAVVATRRLDNGPPETVEIVLNRPIPYNATTRFTFNDGAIEQSIEFTFAPGDIDGDGQATLSDFASFQNCFGVEPVAGACLALDADGNSAIDLTDFAGFSLLFPGP